MSTNTDPWELLAQETLVGRTIKRAWYLSKEEAKQYGWVDTCLALELDNGFILVPSGNRGFLPGRWNGRTPDGQSFTYPELEFKS